MYHLLQQQSKSDWDWWICDSSYCPSQYFSSIADKRIHYLFVDAPMTIGEKRNHLIEESKGDLIVHIDDDDYYSAVYLEEMIKALGDTDFISLSSWYLHDVKARQSYYWQPHPKYNQIHYMVEPIGGVKIKELEIGTKAHPKVKKDFHEVGINGYGFAYLYKRAVWEKAPFQHLDIKEDSLFLEQAQEGGFKIQTLQDREGIAVKIVHDQNVSTVYPQYRIPPFLMERYLPHFTKTIDAYYPYHHI